MWGKSQGQIVSHYLKIKTLIPALATLSLMFVIQVGTIPALTILWVTGLEGFLVKTSSESSGMKSDVNLVLRI